MFLESSANIYHRQSSVSAQTTLNSSDIQFRYTVDVGLIRIKFAYWNGKIQCQHRLCGKPAHIMAHLPDPCEGYRPLQSRRGWPVNPSCSICFTTGGRIVPPTVSWATSKASSFAGNQRPLDSSGPRHDLTDIMVTDTWRCQRALLN